MEFTQEKFEYVRNRAEALYKTLGEVYCPYFKDKISFNARGLEHLKFKRFEKARNPADQFMRFKLLHLAPEIVNATHTRMNETTMSRILHDGTPEEE